MRTRHCFLHLYAAILALTVPVVGQSIDVSRSFGTQAPVTELLSIGDAVVLASFESGEIFRSIDTARTWHHVANRGEDGAILCMAALGIDAIAGTNDGGVLHSSDGGLTWIPRYGLTTGSAVASIFMDVNDFLVLGQDGVLARSTDGGCTWEETHALLTSRARDLLRAPDGKIIVGTSGDGIFLSGDHGHSWTIPVELPASAFVEDLIISPHGCVAAATSDWGMFHSTDSGETWEFLGRVGCTGPQGGYNHLEVWKDTLLLMLGDAGRFVFHDPHERQKFPLSILGHNPGTAILALSDGSILAGDICGTLYRSCAPPFVTDTTEYVQIDTPSSTPLLEPGEEFRQRVVIERKLGRVGSCISGEVLVWNSLTGEETTLSINASPSWRDTFRFVIPDDTPEGEYRIEYRTPEHRPATYRAPVLTQHFRVRSTPAAERARVVLASTPPTAVSLLHGTACGAIYACFGEGSLLHSGDEGRTWRTIMPADCGEKRVRHLTGNPATGLLAILDNKSAYVSHDNGASWRSVLFPMGDVHAIAAERGRMVIAADGELFLSVDSGRTWGSITLLHGVKHNFVFLPGEDTIVVLGPHSILRKPGQDMAWESIWVPGKADRARAMMVHRCFGVLLLEGGILRHSPDFDHNWVDYRHKDLSVSSLRHFSTSERGEVFACLGWDGEVFSTTDHGRTWEKLAGITDSIRRISALCLAGDMLVFGTSSGQIFLKPLLTSPTHVGQRSPAGTDHRMIVYPNPGHGPRQVSVHAGGAGVVRIVVHDMLGRMITTLYDGFMPEGTHNYVFDPAGLAAGQYQVMLQSERGLLRNAVTVLR